MYWPHGREKYFLCRTYTTPLSQPMETIGVWDPPVMRMTLYMSDIGDAASHGRGSCKTSTITTTTTSSMTPYIKITYNLNHDSCIGPWTGAINIDIFFRIFNFFFF